MEDRELLRRVLFPTLTEALRRIDEEGVKLAHYTTVDTAMSIISGESVWLRNARNMNDTAEIQHGIEAVEALLLSDASRRRIEAAMNRVQGGLGRNLLPIWSHIKNNLLSEVYIACFSEHWPKEAPFGRLSMWRAYCHQPDGVALVLNPAPFRLESTV